MNRSITQSPILFQFYQSYLLDADIVRYRRSVLAHYTPATLERLMDHSSVSVRRAAVLALGLIGDYSSNSVLGCALRERDRMTAILAEVAIRNLWKRDSDVRAQKTLHHVTSQNAVGNARQAIGFASVQLVRTPTFAELRYQRGKAWFQLGQFSRALRDFQHVLVDNPFHFDAARMIAHCFMEQGKMLQVLEAFRLALKINPYLRDISICSHTETSSQSKQTELPIRR